MLTVGREFGQIYPLVSLYRFSVDGCAIVSTSVEDWRRIGAELANMEMIRRRQLSIRACNANERKATKAPKYLKPLLFNSVRPASYSTYHHFKIEAASDTTS